jgi:predicted helicase
MPATSGMEAFQTYFDALKSLDINEATELTLRGALEALLTTIAKEENSKIKVIHETRKKKTSLGLAVPDFKVKVDETILGYVETKPVGDDLDAFLTSPQMRKYKELSGNILVTDYLQWLWLRDGKIIKLATLCPGSVVGSHRAKLNLDNAAKVKALIANFCSTPPAKIATTKVLALALAKRCHALREFLHNELTRQKEENLTGRLLGLYEIFKKDVFHELDLDEFANAFAQTKGYGLFFAKLNAGENTPITLYNAKQHIPGNFALIRELVAFLDELAEPEYGDIKWVVEEILSIMNTLDLSAIHKDLAATKDPYIYFYEDFLEAYDKKTRKERGVYYTPPPVVHFIIRAVHRLLKDIFDIQQGLADRKRVTVLDFATGTGTFILEVFRQILEEIPEGFHHQIIHKHLLKNIYGFEYLIAPYTIAQLRSAQYFLDKGYTLGLKERPQVYLTNTLEPIQPQLNHLVPALSREVEAAQQIKEKSILVITGNPPYNPNSKNNGVWITSLIDDYKRVNGKPLGEKNSKLLQDDYVKFIRFAQWKMQAAKEGIVAILTNHAFLENITFRGMRHSLMQTFNQIYVLNLHGDVRKKEKTPEGDKDENIFNITKGVAISLLIKKQDLCRAIYYADLWGRRQDKFQALDEADKDSIPWKKLIPSAPLYLFIPYNDDWHDEYTGAWKITDIFPMYTYAFSSKRDEFAIGFDEQSIKRRMRDMLDRKLSDPLLYDKYRIQDNRDWNLPASRKTLQDQDDLDMPHRKMLEQYKRDMLGNTLSQDAFHKKYRGEGSIAKAYQKAREHKYLDRKIIECDYRPFDKRSCFFGYEFMDRPRKVLLEHVAGRDNMCLIVPRQTRAEIWQDVFIVRCPPDAVLTTENTGNYAFPLFRYFTAKELKVQELKAKEVKMQQELQIIFDDSPTESRKRIVNVSEDFLIFIKDQYGYNIRATDILGYVYAILHSPLYRTRYREFLRMDFPHIPFVSNRKTFETLATLGFQLIIAHTRYDDDDKMEFERVVPKLPEVPISEGDNTIDRTMYDEKYQRLYFNKEQYFSNLSPEVWNFCIGSYKVLHEYLQSRKGRKLTMDVNDTVQRIIRVLHFTIQQMQRIDTIWDPSQGIARRESHDVDAPRLGQISLL